MTKDTINKLAQLVDMSASARPEISPEEFIDKHWRPFLQNLNLSEQRMAWQVYLRAQLNDFHTIVEYLQGLQKADLENLRPTLERLLASFQTPGKKRLAA